MKVFRNIGFVVFCVGLYVAGLGLVWKGVQDSNYSAYEENRIAREQAEQIKDAAAVDGILINTATDERWAHWNWRLVSTKDSERHIAVIRFDDALSQELFNWYSCEYHKSPYRVRVTGKWRTRFDGPCIGTIDATGVRRIES